MRKTWKSTFKKPGKTWKSANKNLEKPGNGTLLACGHPVF